MMSPQEAQKNTAIAEQYERYRKVRVEKQEAERVLAEQTAKEKAEREAFYKSKQKAPQTVTTRKPHPCAKCNEVIPAGQTVIVGTNFVRDRNLNPNFETLHFCHNCRPVSAEAETQCRFYSVCGNSESYRCTNLGGLDCGSKKRRETAEA
jgi:hypothetical protein